MADVTATVSAVRVAGVSAGPLSSVPVSVVSDVGEAADRHRGEASSAQREGEPIDVHTTEYYAPNDCLVTGVGRRGVQIPRLAALARDDGGGCARSE